MRGQSVWTAIRVLVVLTTGIVLGAFLLCLSFLVPDGRIQIHVRDSIYVFETEGEYPSIDNDSAKTLDNWTGAFMLSCASFRNESAHIPERAMGVYRPEYGDASPLDSLILYSQGKEGFRIASCARYWHGYLVFLRPFLYAMDYEDLRLANSALVFIVMALALMAMCRRRKLHLVFPYVLSVLFLRLDVMGYSLQYSLIYYVASVAVFVGVVLEQWLKKRRLVPFYFLITGMVTSYVDLLTYPLVALGLPLALWLAMEEDGTWKQRMAEVIRHSAEWLCGYAGMWIGKWCLASAILGENVFADMFPLIRLWISGDYLGLKYSRWDVILKNMEYGASEMWLIVAAVSWILIFWILLRICQGRRKMAEYLLPCFLIYAMPFIWYILLKHHSMLYAWFTYRNLAVAVCAAVCMGTGGIKL